MGTPDAVMRRRRNELEYPEFPDETVASAKAIIDAAGKLLEHLGLF